MICYIFILFFTLKNAVVEASCAGSPCSDRSMCRSQYGYCGTGSAYCNSQSEWTPYCLYNYPTYSPSLAPSYSPTKYPSRKPTYRPTYKPTNKPTNYPTNNPTNYPTLTPTTAATVNYPPTTTSSAFSAGPTASPGSAPTILSFSNANANLNAPSSGVVGGAVAGGFIGMFGILVVLSKRFRTVSDKAAEDVWTPNEDAALARRYKETHDFDALCRVVPGRAPKSVALRTRQLALLETNNQTARPNARIYSFWKLRQSAQPWLSMAKGKSMVNSDNPLFQFKSGPTEYPYKSGTPDY